MKYSISKLINLLLLQRFREPVRYRHILMINPGMLDKRLVLQILQETFLDELLSGALAHRERSA
jgi:hypothetical protein